MTDSDTDGARRFPKIVGGAIAALFDGGPTHAAIDGAFLSVGLTEVVGGNKPIRVNAAFMACPTEADKFELAEDLLDLLRNWGTFDGASQSVIRTQKAFARGGAILDDDGYVAWGVPEEAAQQNFRTPEARGFNDFAALLATPTINPEPARQPAPVAGAEDLGTGPSARRAPGNAKVAVAYGQDTQARDAMFTFLRSLGLVPLSFDDIIHRSGEGSPFTGAAIETAFDNAQALVIMLTPDEFARLHTDLGDEQVRLQPRPNVIFEAGLALGKNPKHTILVSYGNTDLWSNITGRHYVKLDNSPEKRWDLRNRLEKAGCEIPTTTSDWLSAGAGGDFPSLQRSHAAKREPNSK